MRRQETPPPGHGDDRLLEGAAKSGAGGKPIMTPSLRWAIIFPPGAHCAGSRPEMSCPITEHLLTIAPQSPEQAENCNSKPASFSSGGGLTYGSFKR